MASLFWPKTLPEACVHAYHPALHYDTSEGIVMHFLWRWGDYPSDGWSDWERVFIQGRDDDGRFVQGLFPALQRALTEGREDDRVFALFLLGTLATPEAMDLLISFLNSPHRKERWASAIALGRLKEERVFPLLQTFLLEGFFIDEFFADIKKIQVAQEACRLYKRTVREAWHLYEQTLTEEERVEISQSYRRVMEYLKNTDYEWYLRQRSECAIILGAWGNPVVVPQLREALQAVWKMELDWPTYEGPDESGPDIWHFFQDRLIFTLGQFGVWDALEDFPFSDNNLLVTRIYLILGALQVSDPMIFWEKQKVFRYFLGYGLRGEEVVRSAANPLAESAPVKRLLEEHFGLSPAEQEAYLLHFFKASLERAKRSQPEIDPFSDDWQPDE